MSEDTTSHEPEVEEEDIHVDGCDISGVLELREKKKGKNKLLWFALSGSTLYYYKDAKDISPKGELQIKGFTAAIDQGNDFILKEGDKEVHWLSAFGVDERDRWVSNLNSASSKAPGTAPAKQKLKKQSTKSRLTTGVAGKVAGSGIGKQAIKAAVPEEIKTLISALKRIVSKTQGSKKGNEIEGNVIKIVVKLLVLQKNLTISMEDFLRVDEPMREAFEILVDLRDRGHRLKKEEWSANLKQSHLLLERVEQVLSTILAPHVKPLTLKLVAVTFGILANPEFIERGWTDPAVEEERDILADAMSKYTQFHY